MPRKRRSSRRGQETCSDLRRADPSIEPRARILIVCEGAKTEPIYFDALCRHKRITTREVHIIGEDCGSHPRNVVDYAVGLMNEKQRDDDPYDSVWCVFDRDDHEKIHEALTRARDWGVSVAFSNPCFEIWFLLHFERSTAERHRRKVLSQLKKHIPDYDKAEGVYDLLRQHQDEAISNARTLRKHHSGAGNKETANPSTTVDQLVKTLMELAKPRPD